jgi:hypothetical protein
MRTRTRVSSMFYKFSKEGIVCCTHSCVRPGCGSVWDVQESLRLTALPLRPVGTFQNGRKNAIERARALSVSSMEIRKSSLSDSITNRGGHGDYDGEEIGRVRELRSRDATTSCA